MPFDIREFDEVSSTNDVVKELALEGEPEGVVVCARTQTAGYGRRGNAWESAPGGLYMSLLLRPESEFAQVQTLPLVVAIGVRRAIASFLPEDVADAVQVKWPNDVVVAECAIGGDIGTVPMSPTSPTLSSAFSKFNKICGISSELKHGAICVGIGVNVHEPAGPGPAGGDIGTVPMSPPNAERNKPTYLSELFANGECPSVEQVRDAVLGQFAGIYERWQEFGFAPFRDEYREHLALLGAKVRIEDALAFVGESGMPAREVPCCVVKSVDDEGRLVATACESGDAVKVTAGRVQVLHG